MTTSGELLVLSFRGLFWTARLVLWERRVSVPTASTSFFKEALVQSCIAVKTFWKGWKAGL